MPSLIIYAQIFVDLSSDYRDSKVFNQGSVYFEDTYKSDIKVLYRHSLLIRIKTI